MPFKITITIFREKSNPVSCAQTWKIGIFLEGILLELGRRFTFVGQQVRFMFEDDHYRVYLEFYNRLLQCFVLFDLKIGRLKH